MEVKRSKDSLINSIKSSIKEDVSDEIKNNIIAELQEEIKSDIVENLKSSVLTIKNEIKDSIHEVKSDIRSDIREDLKFDVKHMKSDIRQQMEELKDEFQEDVKDIKDNIRKKIKADVDKLKDILVDEIKDDIVEYINNNIKTQLATVTEEHKKKAEDDMLKTIEDITMEMKIELDRVKESMIESTNEMKRVITDNIKQTVKDDIDLALRNNEFSIELDTARFHNKKQVCVMGVTDSDIYKLVEMQSQIGDNEYVGKISQTKDALILGGIKSLLGSNIVEVASVVYCIFTDTLTIGQPICQSYVLPYYAKIQTDNTILMSTLGKITKICNEVIYVDSNGNNCLEEEYNNRYQTPQTPRRIGTTNKKQQADLKRTINDKPRLQKRESMVSQISRKDLGRSVHIQTNDIIQIYKLMLVHYT